MRGQAAHVVFGIGNGILRCGVAGDAAGRGYPVFLAEVSDLASGTKSAGGSQIAHAAGRDARRVPWKEPSP